MASERYVFLTPEEAASNAVTVEQVERDMAQVERDMARAHVDVLRSELDSEGTDAGVPKEVLDQIAVEAQAAAAVVAELEADAEARGIPTSLSGSLYRIYVTAPATSSP